MYGLGATGISVTTAQGRTAGLPPPDNFLRRSHCSADLGKASVRGERMNKTAFVLIVGLTFSVWHGTRAAEMPEPVGMPRPVGTSTVAMPPSPQPAPLGTEECPRHHPVRGCLGRLRDWLCFRSPATSDCTCCTHDLPCCRPPLYAYFLHRCN